MRMSNAFFATSGGTHLLLERYDRRSGFQRSHLPQTTIVFVDMDNRWSWVVLAAQFVILMIMVGFQHSYGIFFVEIRQRYDVTASMTSMVGSVFQVFASVTAVVVMTFVLGVISERQSVLIGATILTLSLSASCLVTSFPVFVVTLGACAGMGTAFILGPGFVMVGKSFHRHRTLAISLANSGMSVGGVVMPLLIRLLLDTFTFPLGLLTVGAVLAHLYVCACLFRPTNTPLPPPDLPSAERDREDVQGLGVCGDRACSSTHSLDVRRRQSSSCEKIPRLPEDQNRQKVGWEKETIDSCRNDASAKNGTFLSSNPDVYVKSVSYYSNREHSVSKTDDSVLTDQKNCVRLDQDNINSETVSAGIASDVLDSNSGYFTERKESRERDAQKEADNEPDAEIPNASKARSLHRNALVPKLEERLYSSSFQDMSTLSTTPQAAPLLHSASANLIQSIQSTNTHSDWNRHRSFLDILSSSKLLKYSSSMVLPVLDIPTDANKEGVPQRQDLEQTWTEDRTSHRKRMWAAGCTREVCCNAVFWMIVCYQALGCQGGVLARVYLPPLARELQLSDREATLLLTVVSGLDIFSRLLPGVVDHFQWMKTRTLIVFTLLVQGVVLQFTGLFRTMAALLGLCVVLGCLNGVFYAMIQAVIVDFMGMEQFAVSYGFVQLFSGLTVALAFPLTGALSDAMGSYVASFHYLGITQIMAAICLMLLQFVSRRAHAQKAISETSLP